MRYCDLPSSKKEPPCSIRFVRELRPIFSCTFLLALIPLFPFAAIGCNRSSPYLTASPSGFFNPNPAPNMANPQIPAQLAEYERRIKLFDENNRQLTSQNAQLQQQTQLFKEQSELTKRQLMDVSNQLQQSRVAAVQTNQQFRGLEERAKAEQSYPERRGGAKLTANTSSKIGSESLRDLGYPVENDGSVLRLRVPADQLFQPGTAQLTPSASGILDRISETFKRNYARQRIAIEGHTDNSPLYGGTFSTNHQLAAAQSNTVLEHFTRRNQMPGGQLFTLNHGDNYPIADNQSPTSRASNRRIEFVIYPETF